MQRRPAESAGRRGRDRRGGGGLLAMTSGGCTEGGRARRHGLISLGSTPSRSAAQGMGLPQTISMKADMSFDHHQQLAQRQDLRIGLSRTTAADAFGWRATLHKRVLAARNRATSVGTPTDASDATARAFSSLKVPLGSSQPQAANRVPISSAIQYTARSCPVWRTCARPSGRREAPAGGSPGRPRWRSVHASDSGVGHPDRGSRNEHSDDRRRNPPRNQTWLHLPHSLGFPPRV